MPTLECKTCGYSCGSAKAWLRHLDRFAPEEHELINPSLLDGEAMVREDTVRNSRNLLSLTKKDERHFSLESATIRKSLQHESMPLIDAAKRGDLERLATLLSSARSAEDLGKVDAAGMSAMAWAAKTGRCDVIQALLGANASPNLVVGGADDAASEAHPPIYLALTKARFDAAQLLLDAGALASEPEPVRGQTALHAACSSDAPAEIIEALLLALKRAAVRFEGDDDLNTLDGEEEEGELSAGPSVAAGFSHHTNKGGPPSLPADMEGCTPLHGACACGNMDCVRQLLQSASEDEVSRLSHKKVSPLAAACRRGHTDVAMLLVTDHGAKLDPKAVHLCLQKGHGDLLVDLVRASRERQDQPVSSGGVDVCFDDTGETALMFASEAGHVEAVTTLLAMGADATLADHEGHTALMRAAFMGRTHVVTTLLKSGCPVDAVDREGNSALHHAGRGSQEAIFELLELRYDADGELCNHKGEVPKVSAEPCRVQ